MVRNCQVCGNPMFSRNDMGTNNDETFNKDFCSNCYRDGEFTVDRDRTGNHFTSLVYPFAVPYGFSAGMSGIGISDYIPPVIVNNDTQDYGNA